MAPLPHEGGAGPSGSHHVRVGERTAGSPTTLGVPGGLACGGMAKSGWLPAQDASCDFRSSSRFSPPRPTMSSTATTPVVWLGPLSCETWSSQICAGR